MSEQDPYETIRRRALKLGEAGLRVIPLRDGKSPIDYNWGSTSSSDFAKIDKVFNVKFERNLGLPCGKINQNIVCIDIDPRAGGLEFLEKNPELENVCTVVEHSGKGDGGRHLFFKAGDEYLKTNHGVLGDGVDYIGTGAQVVLAPSIHNDTGAPYTQTKGVLGETPLADLPSFITMVIDMDREAKTKKENIKFSPDFEPTFKDQIRVWKILESLKPERGRHPSIGGWITNALFVGYPEAEIEAAAADWLVNVGGREPDPNEIRGMIEFGKRGLADGSLTCTVDGVGREDSILKELGVSTDNPALTGYQPEGEKWERQLQLTSGGIPKKGQHNIELILENDTRLEGTLKYNRMTNQIVKDKLFRWENPSNVELVRAWSDKDTVCLSSFLSRTYLYEDAHKTINAAVSSVAGQHGFHPVQDFIEALPSWNKVPRLDTWLMKVTRCEDTKYNRAVSKHLILSMLARALRPGIKNDTVVILEGRQGNGKSTLCERLSCGFGYTDSLTSMDGKNKDDVLLIKKNWIVELAEIERFISTFSADSIKSMISRQVDSIREPYARHTDDYPRQCIFVGTTNAFEYFRDLTGNRRFLPVQTGHKFFDIDYFDDNRDQIIAEAYQVLKSGWAKGHKNVHEIERITDISAEQDKRLSQTRYDQDILKFIENKVAFRQIDLERVLTGSNDPKIPYFERGKIQAYLNSIGYFLKRVTIDRKTINQYIREDW